MAIETYMLVFRFLHIVAGVWWAGSVFAFAVFVQPAAGAIGPAASPFIRELLGRRRFVDRLIGIAGTTIVAGLFLYVRDVNAFGGFADWIGSAFGVAITIGAVLAIAAFFIGLLGTRPGVLRLMAVSQRMAEAGDPPPPELGAEARRLQERLRVLGRTTLGLLALSVAAMATARFW